MSQALPTPATTNPAADESDLSQDDVFHLLQCRRRRDALRYLKENDGPVRMRDLAEQVAAWEHDTTVRELRSPQRQRVYIPLYQNHLPKLDDAGVIDYQQSRGVVERTGLADVFDPYIEAATAEPSSVTEGPSTDVEARTGEDAREASDAAAGAPEAVEASDESRDWTYYYMGASGFGLALVGGSIVGLPGLAALSGTAIGTIVSGVFAALAAAEHFDARSARHAR